MGQYIPSYEIINYELTPLDIMFYPIFDKNDRLVSMAATAIVNGEIVVSISTSFVKELQSIEPSSKVSIIYANDGSYLLTHDAIVKLADYPADMVCGRGDINAISASELQQVAGASLTGIKSLASVLPVQTYGEGDDSIYLNVSKVLQPPGSSLCWAACVASTVAFKYYGPSYTPYTAQEIADMYGHHGTLGCERVINQMNALFSNMKYTNNGGNNNSFSNIWRSLNATSSPVIGRFGYSYDMDDGHFMVIRGISYYGSFSVMDPLEADSKYRTGTITGTGNTRTFSILSYTGGSTLTLTHFGYKY